MLATLHRSTRFNIGLLTIWQKMVWQPCCPRAVNTHTDHRFQYYCTWMITYTKLSKYWWTIGRLVQYHHWCQSGVTDVYFHHWYYSGMRDVYCFHHYHWQANECLNALSIHLLITLLNIISNLTIYVFLVFYIVNLLCFKSSSSAARINKPCYNQIS